MPRYREYSRTPNIRTLVIRNANYPDRLGPSGKHFLTVIVLQLLWIKFFLQLPNTHTRTHARTHAHTHTHTYIYIYIYIQGDSRLMDITAGGDFLGLCDQKSSYKHVSDFGRLRSYDRLKLGIEGKDY